MITHRPLTVAEAETLHAELKTTPNILGYTVRELQRFRDVLVAEIDGALAGICITKQLRFGWSEIAVVYVLPPFRGNRIGTRLYTEAFDRARERGRHIVTLSRSPEILHLMERFGMQIPVPVWRAPLAFHLQMNRHMMSVYRIRESVRKSTMMKGLPGLILGIKRWVEESP